MTTPATPATPVTLGAGYFDAMYEAASDPWGFEDRWYEQRKYAISVAQLPERRYRSAFEAGCSVGVLTRMLAGRCDRLLSCDLAEAAVQAAARRAVRDVLAYPVWMWHWATPGDPRVPWRRACQVALPADAAARKRAAIAAFTSQLTDRGAGLPPVLPTGDVAHFTRRRQEVLLR